MRDDDAASIRAEIQADNTIETIEGMKLGPRCGVVDCHPAEMACSEMFSLWIECHARAGLTRRANRSKPAQRAGVPQLYRPVLVAGRQDRTIRREGNVGQRRATAEDGSAAGQLHGFTQRCNGFGRPSFVLCFERQLERLGLIDFQLHSRIRRKLARLAFAQYNLALSRQRLFRGAHERFDAWVEGARETADDFAGAGQERRRQHEILVALSVCPCRRKRTQHPAHAQNFLLQRRAFARPRPLAQERFVGDAHMVDVSDQKSGGDESVYQLRTGGVRSVPAARYRAQGQAAGIVDIRHQLAQQ